MKDGWSSDDSLSAEAVDNTGRVLRDLRVDLDELEGAKVLL